MKLKDFDFRIWDRKYNTFLKAEYDYLCIVKKDNNYDYERILDIAKNYSGYDIISFNGYTDDRYEIELYTGLKDKNGKEIYIGDILKWYDDYNRLQFLQVKYNILNGLMIIGDAILIESDFDITEEMEVVGNIHENETLIKGIKMNSYTMIINNKFRRLCEDYNPEALTMLKEYGIENHSKIEILYDNKLYKGKLLVAGENPENEPVIWFKGRKRLIPIFEADVIINRD